MKIIYKEKYNILNQENEIKLTFEVKLNDNKNGINNFDIDNTKINIDELFNNLKNKKIILDENYPIYYSLSKLLFNKYGNLESIEYINNKFNSIIERNDI